MKDKKPLKSKKIYTLKRTPIVLSQKSIDKMNKKRLEKAKSQKSVIKPIVFKKASNTVKTKIKQVSKKQSAINTEMQKVYDEIKLEREPICEGCGRKLPLSFSHTISRHKRPDLQTDKDNLFLECFGSLGHSCHDVWEHLVIPQVFQLLNFDRKLSYIQEKDPYLYEKIIDKLYGSK